MASLDDTEDVALDFGTEDQWNKQKLIRYPMAAVSHLCFRVSAIVFYIVFNYTSFGYVTGFVIIVFLLAIDFWTVKNVTGRLLVGLRWWNHIDEDGTSHWVFESRKGPRKNLVTNAESRTFWLGLVICPILWFCFLFASLIQLKVGFLIIAVLGLVLNGSNLYGYLRCKVGSRKELSSIATQFLGQQMLSRATESLSNPTSKETG